MCKYTYDDLLYNDLKIFQHKNGYRSSEDSLILQDCILNYTSKNFLGNAFEFGTGCGIISILLAAKRENISLTSIEVQSSLYELAEKNVKYCELSPKITLIHMDGRNVAKKFSPGTFEIAFSNPPFFEPNEGRLSPIRERQIAKHEILCSLVDILDIFSYLLKLDGMGFVIYPKTRCLQFDSELYKRRDNLKPIAYKFYQNYANEVKINLMPKFQKPKKGESSPQNSFLPPNKFSEIIAQNNFNLFVAVVQKIRNYD
ncbi:MAG: methyltransferase [Candidatus Cloacimonadota bacterium]|nr:methyltransferase [Candidatus Cloacimonadota bacterium]